MPISVGSLVRWRKGATGGALGVVIEVLSGGQRIRVRLDNGEEFQFALPTDVLQRVQFHDGAHVRIRRDGAEGMVTGRTELSGRVIYDIAFPDGSSRSVPEDSLRPARMSDPCHGYRFATVEQLLAGERGSKATVRCPGPRLAPKAGPTR